MLSRFKSALFSSGPLPDSPTSGNSHVSNSNGSPNGILESTRMPLKFAYSRPVFLSLNSEDEIQVAGDQKIRPIIVPRDASKLPWNLGYAEAVNAGKSLRNEDQADVRLGFIVRDTGPVHMKMPYVYIGCFDGHAGSGAAVVAANQLHQIVHSRLVDILDHLVPPLPNTEDENLKNVKHSSSRALAWMVDLEKATTVESLVTGALEASFWEMDECIRRDRSKFRINGGCTALVALFIAGKLYIANAGDSRAVVVREAKPIPMSFDFTPENERMRIQKLARLKPELLGPDYTHMDYKRRPLRRDIGKRILYRDAHMTGWAYKTATTDDMKLPVVFGEGKRSRVLSTIGVTRGFGDHDLRAQSTTPVLIKPFLSAQPQVTILDLEHEAVTENDVLIMGSDGLWDITSNEKAADIVMKNLNHFQSGGKNNKYRFVSAAQDLVSHSRGKLINHTWRMSCGKMSTIDDISVFVVPLKPYKEEYAVWKERDTTIRRQLEATQPPGERAAPEGMENQTHSNSAVSAPSRFVLESMVPTDPEGQLFRQLSPDVVQTGTSFHRQSEDAQPPSAEIPVGSPPIYLPPLSLPEGVIGRAASDTQGEASLSPPQSPAAPCHPLFPGMIGDGFCPPSSDVIAKDEVSKTDAGSVFADTIPRSPDVLGADVVRIPETGAGVDCDGLDRSSPGVVAHDSERIPETGEDLEHAGAFVCSPDVLAIDKMCMPGEGEDTEHPVPSSPDVLAHDMGRLPEEDVDYVPDVLALERKSIPESVEDVCHPVVIPQSPDVLALEKVGIPGTGEDVDHPVSVPSSPDVLAVDREGLPETGEDVCHPVLVPHSPDLLALEREGIPETGENLAHPVVVPRSPDVLALIPETGEDIDHPVAVPRSPDVLALVREGMNETSAEPGHPSSNSLSPDVVVVDVGRQLPEMNSSADYRGHTLRTPDVVERDGENTLSETEMDVFRGAFSGSPLQNLDLIQISPPVPESEVLVVPDVSSLAGEPSVERCLDATVPSSGVSESPDVVNLAGGTGSRSPAFPREYSETSTMPTLEDPQLQIDEDESSYVAPDLLTGRPDMLVELSLENSMALAAPNLLEEDSSGSVIPPEIVASNLPFPELGGLERSEKEDSWEVCLEGSPRSGGEILVGECEGRVSDGIEVNRVLDEGIRDSDLHSETSRTPPRDSDGTSRVFRLQDQSASQSESDEAGKPCPSVEICDSPDVDSFFDAPGRTNSQETTDLVSFVEQQPTSEAEHRDNDADNLVLDTKDEGDSSEEKKCFDR